MSDIFLSYAREDLATAEVIAAALETEGWSVWWDRTIPAGRDFDRVIEEAIDRAKCIVVLWSKSSVASRWVKTEAGEGARRDVLVPVLIEDVRLPLEFRRIQAANLVQWDQRTNAPTFRRLIGDISGILGVPPRKASPPPKPALDLKEEGLRGPETQPARTEPPVQSILVQTDAAKASEEPTRLDAAAGQTWWLFLLLPLVAIRFSAGGLSFDFQYVAIPIAAWIGYRYRRKGLKAAAIGLLPLLYGSPYFDGVGLQLSPSIYFVSLVVCWAFCYPDRWWRRLASLEVTIPLILCLLASGGTLLTLTGQAGQLGWIGSSLFIGAGTFAIGLSGSRYGATWTTAIAAAILAQLLGFLGVRGSTEDLGGGLQAAARFFSTDVLCALAMLKFGRMLGQAIYKTSPPFSAARFGLFLVVLWLVSVHPLSTKAGVLIGSDSLTLAVAFAAGVVWQRQGMWAVGAAVLLTIAESALVHDGLVSSNAHRLDIGSPDLRVTFSAIGGKLGVYAAALMFCLLGIRLARALGLAPHLRMERPFPEQWKGAAIEPSRKVASARPAAAFLFLPIVPLLGMSYSLSKVLSFRFEYLIVPFAAWLASRYGKHGLVVFGIGGLTYWVGVPGGPLQFGLFPNFYIVGLIVGWAVANPDRFMQWLREFKPSLLSTLAVVLLLPTSVVIWASGIQVGWTSYVLFPFMLFLLGWAGAPARHVIPLIAAVGIAGHFLPYAMGPISYSLGNVNAMVWTTLCYLAGYALSFVFFHAAMEKGAGAHPESRLAGRVASWLKSRSGYIGLGLIMLAAPLLISIRLGEIYIGGGSTPIMMLGAFIAGFLWTQRGIQLTAASVAILIVLCSFDYRAPGFEFQMGSLRIGARAPAYSFFLVALCAILYAIMGARMASWHASHAGRIRA